MSAPSGYTALDFVGFTDKGTYNPLATYMRNDLVHYGGNIWKCLVDNTTGITPVEGANWTLWIGTSANLAERTIAPLLNNPADAAYGVGRQIIYDDWLWEVIAPIAVGDALVDYAVDPTNANIKKSAPVETQLLAVKAEADATDNMIAPTETNASSSSAAYAVGDQLILNNVLYTVTTAITIGDALVSGTGGNIEASDSLTDQLADKVDSSDLGTAAAKDSTNAVTQSSTDLVESGAVYSEVNTVKQALSTYESVCGVVNLLPNNAVTQVINGITYTVYADGTVVANGTATADAGLRLIQNTSDNSNAILDLVGNSVKMSGCPSGGDSSKFFIDFWSASVTYRDYGSGIEFTVPSSLRNDSWSIAIFVKSGQTVSNLRFTPMIALASYNGDYVPYAKTNRELTVDAVATTVSNQITSSVGTFDLNYISKKNGIVQVDIQLQISENVTGYHNVATIPQGYAPIIDFTATGYLYRASEDKQMHGGLVFRSARNVQTIGSLVSGDILRLSATYISK